MAESSEPPTAPAAAAAVTCEYPGCEQPPRPPTSDRGAKPKYCGLLNDNGKPAHTPLTALREKDRLRRQSAGDPAPEPEPEDLGRPITMGVARAAELRDAIHRDVAGLVDRITAFEGLLERIADPTAAEAQIETVQSEAAEHVAAARADVAREIQRRQRAETAAEQAVEAAMEVDEQLTAAEAARAGAEDRAAAARAETERVISEAEQQVDQARTAAAEQVAAAEADRDAQVAAARAEAAAQVQAAHAERDQALQAARQEADRANTAVSRAEAEVVRARHGEADARADAERTRQEAADRLAEQRAAYEDRVAELTRVTAEFAAVHARIKAGEEDAG